MQAALEEQGRQHRDFWDSYRVRLAEEIQLRVLAANSGASEATQVPYARQDDVGEGEGMLHLIIPLTQKQSQKPSFIIKAGA